MITEQREEGRKGEGKSADRGGEESSSVHGEERRGAGGGDTLTISVIRRRQMNLRGGVSGDYGDARRASGSLSDSLKANMGTHEHAFFKKGTQPGNWL